MEEDKSKTCYKGLGFCGFGLGANTAEVEVKDGKIVRIRPFQYDKKYAKEEIKPWKLESRGKTFDPGLKTLLPPFAYVYKKRAFSKNRIPYPLKRIDWDPKGERNPQNRGVSKYVRISWDEATDIIADEIRRVHKEYGPYALMVQGDGHGETKAIHGPHGCQVNMLELLGGCSLQSRNPDSWEGWYWGAKHVWGQDPVGQGDQTNLWKDVSDNAEMILCWGCDQETTPWGWGGQQASRLSYWFSSLGIETIYICPDLNYGAAVHADKWIPVIPNTDTALQMAIAYTWFMEDTYDKEYVATHTVGFEDFKAYIMGEEDGVPKTPQWASPICGVPVRIIKTLARKWAAQATTIAHGNGGSFIRSTYSHEPARMEVCLLGMQGLGKPGRNQMKYIEWNLYNLHSQNPGPRTAVIPSVRGAYQGTAGTLPASAAQIIPKTLVPDAIMADAPMHWYGTTKAGYPAEDQFLEYDYPLADGGAPIRMIWSDSPCWTTCWNGGNRFIDALRSEKIEFFLAQQPWMENDCLFADIILPINTKFEEEDIAVEIMGGQYNALYYEGQCIDPIGESKSDFEAVAEVAKKLGIYSEYTENKTYEDLIKRGYDMSGVTDYASYQEFREKEYIVVPVADDWEEDAAGFANFCNDPEQYPLTTPTGLLEFKSTALEEYFPDDEERPPVPHWVPYGKSHAESLLHERSKKYPYMIVSNHPRWREHANLDDVSWLREIPTCKVKGEDGYLYEPLWIHPIDAAAKGIKDGDIVELFNDRGSVLGGAYVTERVMPGVVYQDHGARLDPIDAGKIDRGGANNLICPGNVTSQNCAGEVTSGFLVDFQKADMTTLRQRYPAAFQKSYDKAIGVYVDAWLEEGEQK